jgi:hypothetical protein
MHISFGHGEIAVPRYIGPRAPILICRPSSQARNVYDGNRLMLHSSHPCLCCLLGRGFSDLCARGVCGQLHHFGRRTRAMSKPGPVAIIGTRRCAFTVFHTPCARPHGAPHCHHPECFVWALTRSPATKSSHAAETHDQRIWLFFNLVTQIPSIAPPYSSF